ncbi:MAG: hypothetical protein JWM49_1638 [Microbacteriaceae bacterium]|nr:hypothetical protein [Microbacteriaceae bacterium]
MGAITDAVVYPTVPDTLSEPMINQSADSDHSPSGAELVDGADLAAPPLTTREVHGGAFSSQDISDYDEWALSQDFG